MPTEIEVTPEMIEAGVEALAGAPKADGDNASEIVAAVYTAMERVRRADWPKWARVATKKARPQPSNAVSQLFSDVQLAVKPDVTGAFVNFKIPRGPADPA